MSNPVLKKFKSVIERERINLQVLWDKISDISNNRDEEDLGISFEDINIDNGIYDEDLPSSFERIEPSIEEILNKLIVIDLTTNPSKAEELRNQFNMRGLSFIVDFLDSLTETDVLDYINDDICFDDIAEDRLSDFELEVVDFLDTLKNKEVSIFLRDYKEECNLKVYLNSGRVHVIMDGFDLDFKNQDEELQEAIIKELRSGNYDLNSNSRDLLYID